VRGRAPLRQHAGPGAPKRRTRQRGRRRPPNSRQWHRDRRRQSRSFPQERRRAHRRPGHKGCGRRCYLGHCRGQRRQRRSRRQQGHGRRRGPQVVTATRRARRSRSACRQPRPRSRSPGNGRGRVQRRRRRRRRRRRLRRRQRRCRRRNGSLRRCRRRMGGGRPRPGWRGGKARRCRGLLRNREGRGAGERGRREGCWGTRAGAGRGGDSAKNRSCKQSEGEGARRGRRADGGRRRTRSPRSHTTLSITTADGSSRTATGRAVRVGTLRPANCPGRAGSSAGGRGRATGEVGWGGGGGGPPPGGPPPPPGPPGPPPPSPGSFRRRATPAPCPAVGAPVLPPSPLASPTSSRPQGPPGGRASLCEVPACLVVIDGQAGWPEALLHLREAHTVSELPPGRAAALGVTACVHCDRPFSVRKPERGPTPLVAHELRCRAHTVRRRMRASGRPAAGGAAPAPAEAASGGPPSSPPVGAPGAAPDLAQDTAADPAPTLFQSNYGAWVRTRNAFLSDVAPRPDAWPALHAVGARTAVHASPRLRSAWEVLGSDAL